MSDNLCLLTKPPQFTSGKTKNAINLIKKNYKTNKSEYNYLHIIVTHKSLQDTEQWFSRLNKEEFFENKVKILSSQFSFKSKDSKNKFHYKNVCEFGNEMNANISEIPKILIVCNHKQRVIDDIIHTLLGKFNLIHKFKFHFSIDEVDANLGLTRQFLKITINKDKGEINDIYKEKIFGILFITATAFDKFWCMLNEFGIYELKNTNYGINFREDNENYRTLKHHNIIEHDNDTKNPLDYIKDVLLKRKINENERKIIFAPGHSYTNANGFGSHEEIKNYFINRNYCVLVMNGKSKEFIQKKGDEIEKINLKDFQTKYGLRVVDELRDSFKKWNELNPTTNLLITGFNIVVRGVTFNTTGFNFTDMIISEYHGRHLDNLYQLQGRGTGGKQYVNKMNVVCTSEIKTKIIDCNNMFEDILSLNPEKLSKKNFEINRNQALEDPHIEYCKTFDDAIKYFKSKKIKGNGPIKRKPNNNGYYESTIRSNKKVYTVSEVESEKKHGLANYNYRLYPCYKNKNDKSTLWWLFIHY